MSSPRTMMPPGPRGLQVGHFDAESHLTALSRANQGLLARHEERFPWVG